MSLSITGRKIKVIFNNELNEKKDYKILSKKFSHIKIVLLNKTEKHLLFTDEEINKGLERAKENNICIKISWLKEFWLSDFIDINIIDIKNVIKSRKLPDIALKYNHIRLFNSKCQYHLLFSDKEIKKALKRAEGKKLPSLSWLNIKDVNNGKIKRQEQSKSQTARIKSQIVST